MTYQNPKIKIHVAAPDVTRASQTIFGLDTETIIKAMMGDEEATTHLADYANMTTKARRNIKPVLKQAFSIYDGTKDINQAVLYLLKSAAKNGGQIVQMKGQGLVLNKQWMNFLEQQKQKVTNDLTEVDVKHAQQMNLLTAQHQVNLRLGEITYRDKLTKMGNSAQQKLAAMQSQADKEYEAARLAAIQRDGSQANLGAIPQRTLPSSVGGGFNLSGITGAIGGFFRGVGNFFGRLIRSL
ncbi:hypothetical protein DSM106972_099210 [Dulcicalothrix desertica PCC 7102]|uniref:Uncharacterized protein n=1 Tax=Dulcicalothrix desertica PCC 7102 TaxID=232991 RepID=A0A3S1BVC1_9CYAN|nr:hypothetical protein [Dulcicalothrix desertica]RUS92406.1 hypothetical protein DSM106972_099210 [Dulcicalothrix desertica PCC 7102]TWH62513.1 hypothetical protein CAL7102_00004 [Dulcicalothrix desertica PCC 7102]TWH62868.1 hypothetical protein CAL7102_00408 [Dulcicalothrix desertica PCC 7102]